MKNRCLILFFIILFVVQPVYTQNMRRLDSLFKVLDKNKTDSAKCLTLIDLSKEYRFNDINKAKEYNEEAKKLAVSLNNQKLYILSLLNESALYSINSNNYRALEIMYDALNKAEKSGCKCVMPVIYCNLGSIYWKLENYSKAEEYYKEALKYSKYCERKNNSGWIYNNLANVYIHNSDYVGALNLLNKAIKIIDQSDTDILSMVYSSIGECYSAIRNYSLALLFFNNADKICTDNNINYTGAVVKYDISNIWFKKRNYQKCLDYLWQSLKICLDNSYKDYIYKNYKLIAECYENLGDSKAALENYKNYMEYREYFLQEENYKKLNEFNNRYSILAKQNEIAAKDKNIKVQESRISNQSALIKILFVSGIILLVLLSLLFKFLKKFKHLNVSLGQKNKEITDQNEEIKSITNNLEQQRDHLELVNQTKDKFFSIIAHDLKNPIGSFGQMTELLSDSFDKMSNDDIKRIIRVLQNSAKYSFELLSNLLEWSRSQTGQINYNPMNYNLYDLVQTLINIFEVQTTNKNIQIFNEIDHELVCYFDRNMITTVIRNLISNSVKFTNKGGIIKIYNESNEKRAKIYVEDNGVGMSKDLLYEIFRIDTKVTRKGTENEKGTGLGLILCKEFVEKNNGSIGVESEEGVGAKFWFTLSKEYK